MKRNGPIAPIHICIFAPWAYGLLNESPKAVFGGAEINLYYLAKHLAKKKEYQVTFLIGDYGQPEIQHLNGICFKKVKNFIYKKKNKKSTSKAMGFKEWITGISKERYIAREFLYNSYDVILVTTASLLLTRAVLWGKYIKNAKIIFRFANDTDVRRDYFRKTKKNWIKDSLYWWGVRHSDQIICQTKNQKMLLEETGKYEIQIIENAFPIARQEGKKRFPKKILWVGRADTAKRPELFLRLAIKIPEEEFLMIISDKNSLQKEIMKKAKEIPNLEVIEYVPFDRIQSYFNNARLFVNTSAVEGFPNTFIQAGAAGIPILSFLANPDNIIGNYNIGYVCNDSLKEAAHFIKNLKEDKEKEMGENNFLYMHSHHNIEKTVAKYEAVIKKLYQ